MDTTTHELGPYRLDVLLGSGGMGEVYRAWDQRLERWVAVKRLYARDATADDRLLREARAAAAIGHPAILQVFDVLQSHGDGGATYWIVMELVDGPDLATLVQDGPLDVGLVLDYACQIADGLGAAHAKGIVHRDLKSENVMVLPSGHVKILDFGLATTAFVADDAVPRRRTLECPGTPRAMPPEQILGGEADFRSDLFALGVLLYELLSARSPFRAPTPEKTVLRVLNHRQPSLRKLRPQVSRKLAKLVDRLLEKDPSRRPESTAAVAQELSEIAAANPLFKPSLRGTGLHKGTAWATKPAVETTPDEEALVRTLLLSDLVGSTRPASDLLRRHDRLARRLLAEHGGSEIESSGCGAMVLFERPSNAVRYALAYHETLRGLSDETGVELRGRVGIHLGEVILRPGGKGGVSRGSQGVELGGLARPTLLRLVSLAEGGQTLLTRAAYYVALRAADEQGDDWQWLDHGPYHFRDVDSAVDVFEVGVAGVAPLCAPKGSAEARRGMAAPPLLRRTRGRPRSRPADVPPLTLRQWPPPELPTEPYPVLLPYTHPDLLAGREQDVEKLRWLLRTAVPILGLGAPSGTGKSSLLVGGLVPALRAEGHPVALVRHPHEPGVLGRLLGDLLEGGEGELAADWRGFVERLAEVERLAGVPPLLVLDQLEDVLRDEAAEARAGLGTLLAATARRRPGIDQPLCHWLLAYRNERHGEVLAWLQDVLRGARGKVEWSGLDLLPHDLSGPERFQSLSLSPLATPASNHDPLVESIRVFQAVLEKPLRQAVYGLRFAPGHAERLARVFAEARLKSPEAPLVPELQVVLAHLLARSTPEGLLRLGDDLSGLVEEALANHLRHALEAAFPTGSARAATYRARALLALRELATATGERSVGRRDEGIPADKLARAIGEDGERILEQLATPLARLILLRPHPDGLRYVLSHDRMAEAVVRMVEKQGGHGKLLVDAELLALHRFVAVKTALHASQPSTVATEVPRRHFRDIAAHAEALLWDDERRAWWAACRHRRRAELGRYTAVIVATLFVLVLVSWVTWSWVERRSRFEALLDQVVEGEPSVALQALAELTEVPRTSPRKLLSLLRQRETAMDVLERGVSETTPGEVVLRLVEIALPWVAETPEDPVLLANLVWALDYGPGREPAYAARARALRDQVLERLRQLHPPPPTPETGDPDWVEVTAGTFQMGSPEGEGEDQEHPRHEVKVSAFRLERHEVTHAEYRRLRGEQEGGDDLPVAYVTWYEAYTYAAWLGGRLPTEAEWEYAARAGCPYIYCARDAQEAGIDEVAWTLRNSKNPEAGDEAPAPVMRLEPNPWGLYDMVGNLWEWSADGYVRYKEGPLSVDPWSPATASDGLRALRGGGFGYAPRWSRPASRYGFAPGEKNEYLGWRVLLPAPKAAASPEL